MHQYESDTWYDQNGRITFTVSKGLLGVGFSRFEWNSIRGIKTGLVSGTIIYSAIPGKMTEKTIEYLAPFDLCQREEDYRVVWKALNEL